MEKIYGRHSARAIFLTRPKDIRRMVILSGSRPSLNKEYIKFADSIDISPEFLSWGEFNRVTSLTENEKHQGVCIFVEPRAIYTENDFGLLKDPKVKVVVALDQISNPQSLATILRSGAFFGIDAILLLKNRSTDITPLVTRIAVGGAEFVKIFKITNLARGLDKLKKAGFWVYGLDERGDKVLSKADFAEKVVIVVGAEGEGIRLKTSKYCDELVRIPGGRKGVECLNAGVAVAVALAEIFR